MSPDELRPSRGQWLLLVAVTAAAVAFMVYRGSSDQAIYTLYRSSGLDPLMRIHVATFDVADGAKYNQENCNIVQDQMQRRPEVTVKYWCEQGRFKP